MRLSFFPLLFLAYLLMEISVLIMVGGEIGVLPTLGLILLSGIVGGILMRVQGLSTLSRIQSESAAGRVPGRELVHGMMILLAGFLLLLPGFVTDLIGILLFIPPVRDLVWRWLRNKITIITPPGFGRGGRPTVDLSEDEFRRTDRNGPPSGHRQIDHE